MFISEIPVRCMSSTGNGEKTIQWMNNLNSRTTVQDVIMSICPACKPDKYALYIHLDRKRQILKDTARIYKIVAKINQRQSSRRLLFEIRPRKRVRFAEEILVQTIQRDYEKPSTIPLEKRLEKLKENFQKYIHHQQETYFKRTSLTIINKNLLSSSDQSDIHSKLTNKTMLETLV